MSSLTVFLTFTGCVQKRALQAVNIASHLELSAVFSILSAPDTLCPHMRSHQIFSSPCVYFLLNVSPIHIASPSPNWQGVSKPPKWNNKISICSILLRRLTYQKMIGLIRNSSGPFCQKIYHMVNYINLKPKGYSGRKYHGSLTWYSEHASKH